MQDIATSIKQMSEKIAPLDDLSIALDILNQHNELTDIQKLDIGEYLVLPSNKNQAILFQKLGEMARKTWLTRRLAEIDRNAGAAEQVDADMQVEDD